MIALLIVIANSKCKRLNHIMGMRGSSIYSPWYFPVKIVASIIFLINFFSDSLVPLHSRGGFIFLARMIGEAIFKHKICGANPGRSNEFKYSIR